jgi:hypothetical protein
VKKIEKAKTFIIYYILTVNESRLPKIFLTHQKNHVDHATESKIKKRRKNKQLKASVFSKLVRILTITLSSKIKLIYLQKKNLCCMRFLYGTIKMRFGILASSVIIYSFIKVFIFKFITLLFL